MIIFYPSASTPTFAQNPHRATPCVGHRRRGFSTKLEACLYGTKQGTGYSSTGRPFNSCSGGVVSIFWAMRCFSCAAFSATVSRRLLRHRQYPSPQSPAPLTQVRDGIFEVSPSTWQQSQARNTPIASPHSFRPFRAPVERAIRPPRRCLCRNNRHGTHWHASSPMILSPRR